MKRFPHLLRTEWRRIAPLWTCWALGLSADVIVRRNEAMMDHEFSIALMGSLMGLQFAGFFGGILLLATHPSLGSRAHTLSTRPVSVATFFQVRLTLLIVAFLVPLAAHEAAQAASFVNSWAILGSLAWDRCASALPLAIWIAAFANLAPTSSKAAGAALATPILLMMAIGFYFGPITDHWRASHPNLWFPNQFSRSQLVLWMWGGGALTLLAAFGRRRLAWNDRQAATACLALVPASVALLPLLPEAPAPKGLSPDTVAETLRETQPFSSDWSQTRQQAYPGFIGLQHSVQLPQTDVPAAWELRWSRGPASLGGAPGTQPLNLPGLSPHSVGYYHDSSGMWAAAREHLGQPISVATESHHSFPSYRANFTYWIPEDASARHEPDALAFQSIGHVTTWRFLGEIPLTPNGGLDAGDLSVQARTWSPSETGPRGLSIQTTWIDNGDARTPGNLRRRENHIAYAFWLPEPGILIDVANRWAASTQRSRPKAWGSRLRKRRVTYAGRNARGAFPINPPGVRPEHWEDARLLVLERVYLGSITKQGAIDGLDLKRLPPVNYGSGPEPENQWSVAELDTLFAQHPRLDPDASEAAVRANVAPLLEAIASTSRRPTSDSPIGRYIAQLVHSAPAVFLDAYPWMPSEIRFFLDQLLPEAVPDAAKTLVLDHARRNPQAFLELAVQCGWSDGALQIAQTLGDRRPLPLIALPLLAHAPEPSQRDLLVKQFSLQPRARAWDAMARVTEIPPAIAKIAHNTWERWIPIYERGVIEDLNPVELGLAAGFPEALRWLMEYTAYVSASTEAMETAPWNLAHLITNRFDLGPDRQDMGHDLERCARWLLQRPAEGYQFHPITRLWSPLSD